MRKIFIFLLIIIGWMFVPQKGQAQLKIKNISINPNTNKMFFNDDHPDRNKNLNSKYIIPIKPYLTRRHIWRDRSFSGDRDDHLLKIMKMTY